MGIDTVVLIGRMMLQEVIILAAPVLGLIVLVSLVINVVQVLTSLQDQTLSNVPRLLALGGALFFFMPWMWRHLAQYTIGVLGDFHRVLQ